MSSGTIRPFIPFAGETIWSGMLPPFGYKELHNQCPICRFNEFSCVCSPVDETNTAQNKTECLLKYRYPTKRKG